MKGNAHGTMFHFNNVSMGHNQLPQAIIPAWFPMQFTGRSCVSFQKCSPKVLHDWDSLWIDCGQSATGGVSVR